MALSKEKIEQWRDTADTLKLAKAQEMKLRKEIVAEIFEGSKIKGKKFVSVETIKLQAVNKTKVDLDKEALEAILEDLDESALACIKRDPKLIAKELKELPDDNLLWEVITEKPAAPGLEIIEDKGD